MIPSKKTLYELQFIDAEQELNTMKAKQKMHREKEKQFSFAGQTLT
jgi:hypothetical protein